VTLTPGPTPPLMEAIEGALVDHVGPGAGMFVSTVFSLHDPDEARRLFTAAGFDDVEIEQGSLSLRLAPPADFLWQYVRSTPLAETIAKLDESTRADLERDVVARCQPFVEGDGTALEPGWLIATGRVT